MNFCYCIGGSAARVAEVAAHLCAMNLTKGEDVTFIIADKDANCGGTVQARGVIEAVTALASDGKTGLKRSSCIVQDGKKEFCKSNLRVEPWNFSKHVGALSHDELEDASLESALSSEDPNMRTSDKIIFDAFYSKEDQTRDTREGFYGRPAIGALIFKYMVKEGNWSASNIHQDEDIAAPVKKYLRDNLGEKVRVFVIGSIFGGTGASLFSNLAAHIRTSIPTAYKNRLTISGSLLLPYFTFTSGDGALIDPKEFYIKSKEALTQYASDKNLLRNENAPDGYFDSVYICGQNPLHTTARQYSTGGSTQNNQFDFVDLAAAKAMTEFFACDEEQLNKVIGGQIFEYRLDDGVDGELAYMTMSSNTVGLLREMVAMLSFCSFIVCKVYAPLRLDGNNPVDINMFESLYRRDEIVTGLIRRVMTTEYQNKIKPDIERIANSIMSYCESYLRFLYDIAKNGNDWSDTNQNQQDRNYSLFSVEYISELQKICVLIRREDNNVRGLIDEFSCRTDCLPGMNGGVSPNDVEMELQHSFNGKARIFSNSHVDANLRFGDYIHEAFAVCYRKAGAQ